MSEQLPTPSPWSGGLNIPGEGPVPVFRPDEPMGSEPEEEGGPNLRRYLDAVLRYKWAILGVVLLGTTLGVLVARRLKPEYTAQATIWIEVGRNDQSGPIRTGGLLESSAWVDLLRSYIVLDHVVRSERLFLDYREPSDSAVFRGFELMERFRPGDYRLELSEDGRTYELKADRGFVLEQGSVGDSIGVELGFLWLPPAGRMGRDRTIEFAVLTPRDASTRLSDQLQTRLPREFGNFMRLELSGTDAARLSRTLNGLTDRYVEVAAELKRSKLDELTAILEEQLLYAQQRLAQAETDLQGFRVQTITLPTESNPVTPGLAETQDPVFDNYFSMRIEREELERDRRAIEAALAAQAEGVVPPERLWAIASVQRSSDLRQALTELTEKQSELRVLRTQYTDEHVQVQRLQTEVETLENRAIPSGARAVISQIEQRMSVLDDLIDSTSSELQSIPPRMIEEARLRRQVTIAENLYTDLQSRYESARLAAVSSIPDVRILDRATVPNSPTNPDAKPRAMAMAFLMSLGAAIAGAILLDRMDRRVRYPEQVTRDIGLPILSAIPMAAGNGENEEQTEQVVEAFRELRLSLTHAYGTAGPVVITVTSPGSGDGKSFVSSNLALAFADQGHRTLLLDGDIRRGSLHNVLGGDRTPGLTDFLAGTVSEESLIQHTEYPNVDFIGSGTWRRTGPELLGSPTMHQFITRLRSRYSVVIVDSAPLGAGVDAFVLGTMTGNMLMVLRTGTTDRELAGAKLEVLTRLPIRILGAALNAVPSRGAYRYYSYLSNYQLPPGTPESAGADTTPASV